MKQYTILAGDIGGVNARLAVFALREGRLELEYSLWLPSAQLANEEEFFEAARAAGLPLGPEKADILSLAAAGPVEGETLFLTNTPLVLDMRKLRARYGPKKILLMNDFAAQGHAVCSPLAKGLRPLFGTIGTEGQPKLVIGAGTGFGVAFVSQPLSGSAQWHVAATEYAQSPYPFYGEEEISLSRFACAELGQNFVRVDDILSGRGLALVHAFVSGNRHKPEDIGPNALQHESPTLMLFARLYARIARSLAFTALCSGGLYIAGGLAARNPLLVSCKAFGKEFYNTLAYQRVLENIPVYHLADQQSGLWGAAWAARQQLLLERA